MSDPRRSVPPRSPESLRTRGWVALVLGVLLVLLTPVWFMLSVGWALSGYRIAEWFFIVMVLIGLTGVVLGAVWLGQARRRSR